MANDIGNQGGNAESEKKLHPRYDLKLYQKISRPEDKKLVFIKEISKVLTEIEETKKTRKLIYFSYLYKKAVYDSEKKQLGYLKDLAISGGEKFPEVSHILIVTNGDRIVVPWQNVREFGDFIMLDSPYERLDKRPVRGDDIFLGDKILDKQVVDVNGLKVIRVNDIALTYIKNKLAVVNIDIGTKSIFRRIGLEKFAELIPFNITDHPVPWDTIEPLSSSIEKIHLKVPCPRVSDLHPADVAELFEELSLRERTTLLKSMKRETAAKVLLECEPEVQKSIINSLITKRIAAILEKMPPNDAANLISDYDKDRLARILKRMDKHAAEKLEKMLSYKAGTAARHMSDLFIEVRADSTVEETINHLRGLQKYPDNLYYIYVVDEHGVLCGVVSLKHLILADPRNLVKDIMVSKMVTVDIIDPIEYVRELITKYDLMSLPATDVNGRIVGVINIEDILEVVVERTKSNQPIELTEEQKEDLMKEKGIKRYYSNVVRDMGQLVRHLERIRPRKKEQNGVKNGKLPA